MKLKSSGFTLWSTLLVAGSAQFLVLLESTVITIAMPPIGLALGDGGWLAWVLSGYLLAFGAFLLPGGVWADRIGHRKVFIFGLAGFAATSTLCALSPSIHFLVGARALQGASAGALAASALGVVLTRYTDPRERAIALTVWSALGVVGAVIGSLIAGPLVMWLGWPSVFWINAVSVAILAPFAFLALRSVKPGTNELRAWPALAAATGTAVILAGLDLMPQAAGLSAAVVTTGTSLVVIVVLAQNRSAAPTLPVRLFKLRSYRTAATGLFLGNGLMIATMFAYSQHLQFGYGLPAATTSFALLPMSLAALVIAFVSDPLISRFSDTVVFLAAATGLTLGAFVLLGVALLNLPWPLLIIGGTLIGAGLPACFVLLNRWAFANVAPKEAGAASGFTNMLTTLGGATIVALAALSGSLMGQGGAYAVLLAATLGILGLALTSGKSARK